MKTALIILLVLTMPLAFCACGQKKPAFVVDDGTGNGSINNSVTSSENSSTNSEVSSKNESTSSTLTPSTSTSTSSKNETIDLPGLGFDPNQIIVACWGDSVTEGMGMHSKSYPTKLQALLGDKYKVFNGGDGGEKTVTIAARQGAYKVYTTSKITFYKNEDSIIIGTESRDAFVTKDGKSVVLTSLLGNGISVNTVKINGEEFTLDFQGSFVWSPRSFKLYLQRMGDSAAPLVIPAGSEVVFANTDLSTKGGVDIYMMGANGGYKDNAEYKEQLKAMIKHHGNDKYLIVQPYWTAVDLSEFGDHVVYFEKLAVEKGLAFEGITPTEADKSACSAGKLPPSFRYENSATDVHLSQYGYDFLAHCIYEQGKTLGYFK
ncbi:MAG: hypothetical protein IKV81_07635 [Clostridia bacterium]|nr:hypothetical protein [Clostridia bacterium]